MENRDIESMGSALAFEVERILPALQRRREVGSIRGLLPFHHHGDIDFSSNDYLGLAQNIEQHNKVQNTYHEHLQASPSGTLLLGATGSRLLTGDSDYAHVLEQRLAAWHKRPAALICNSGYDANMSVLSCVTKDSHVILDELSHNSLMMGVKLGRNCTVQTFVHNSLDDLRRLLEEHKSSKSSKPVLVVVESVYSMDGDVAPLQQVLDLSLEYNASVIVDEAHGLGVYGENGMGVLEQYSLENHPALLCSIHTFGKAAGCHGAVICGSTSIKEFLLNYGRPIIYSTCLPVHALVTIACSYESMAGSLGRQLRKDVRARIAEFRKGIESIMKRMHPSIGFLETTSPIQALVVPGNVECIDFCKILHGKSGAKVRLYPIRSPTVPKGEERVRIIVHAHNTSAEVSMLLSLIDETLTTMGYCLTQKPTLKALAKM
eukprot:Nitzschia sp. Nitz4//scaffold10_size219509//50425//51723//NITZ4_001408-RA/size219509-processed-gene-0.321-mRNA-1//-1//CDS//3329532860//8359//frame0